MQMHLTAFYDWFVPEAYTYSTRFYFQQQLILAYISIWVSSELFFFLLSPLPYHKAIWKKQKPTPQVHTPAFVLHTQKLDVCHRAF